VDLPALHLPGSLAPYEMSSVVLPGDPDDYVTPDHQFVRLLPEILSSKIVS
jgi:hypothetical protein